MENVEEIAKAMGHVSEDEWDESHRGPWKTAEEYVELAQQKLPVARQNLEKMAKDIVEFKSDLKSMGQILKASESNAMEAEKRGYDRAKEQYEKDLITLREEYKVAAKDGDDSKMTSLERRMDNLTAPTPPAADTGDGNNGGAGTQNDKEFEAFKLRNEWYGNDVDMTVYCDTTLAQFMNSQHNNVMGTRAWYDKATELMKAKFPDNFGEPPQGPEGGGGEPPPKSPKKRTFDALPKDAQADCDNMVKMGYIKDRKRYVELYEWEDKASGR